MHSILSVPCPLLRSHNAFATVQYMEGSRGANNYQVRTTLYAVQIKGSTPRCGMYVRSSPGSLFKGRSQIRSPRLRLDNGNSSLLYRCRTASQRRSPPKQTPSSLGPVSCQPHVPIEDEYADTFVFSLVRQGVQNQSFIRDDIPGITVRRHVTLAQLTSEYLSMLSPAMSSAKPISNATMDGDLRLCLARSRNNRPTQAIRRISRPIKSNHSPVLREPMKCPDT